MFNRRDVIKSIGVLPAVTLPDVRFGLGAQGKNSEINIGIISEPNRCIKSTMERLGIEMALQDYGTCLDRPISVSVRTKENSHIPTKQLCYELIKKNKDNYIIGGVHPITSSIVAQVSQEKETLYFNTNSQPLNASTLNNKFIFNWGIDYRTATYRMLNALCIDDVSPIMIVHSQDYQYKKYTHWLKAMCISIGFSDIETFSICSFKSGDHLVDRIRIRKPRYLYLATSNNDSALIGSALVDTHIAQGVTVISGYKTWSDIDGQQPCSAFPSNWFHNHDLDAVNDFSVRYRTFVNRHHPASKQSRVLNAPNSVFYNAYMAMGSLLEALSQREGLGPYSMIDYFEGRTFSARQRMQTSKAWIDPNSHNCIQDIYRVSPQFDAVNRLSTYKVHGQI
ncbi:ABC transporter substrate-binding protein [Vibrio sp. ZSDZ65]|uniref:ABC transporter substrate-binding protein n=1 Tax=Vibrio qingdaonensis TaxID=2829491 RepID=A0A9X3CST4_9VIBR|nr:ABC transporter substrate-binding protein [Vibrio qingdaonensis]MCW8349017.1 ABC transporter substrate-binding protein [Vibrio qingdaonensis]